MKGLNYHCILKKPEEIEQNAKICNVLEVATQVCIYFSLCFYKFLNYFYSNSNISTTTTTSITQFLLASGIHFESFMTFLPDIY